jgi:hypothetical protein
MRIILVGVIIFIHFRIFLGKHEALTAYGLQLFAAGPAVAWNEFE